MYDCGSGFHDTSKFASYKKRKEEEEMKRILIAALAVLCLCGCGDKGTESTSSAASTAESNVVSDAVIESDSEQTDGTSLSSVFAQISETVGLPSMNEFNEQLLQRYYGITPEMVSDYAGGMDNSGVGQDEILLVKASDESQVEALRNALQTRYDQKLNEQENYNPEEAEKIRNCEVRVSGLYVTLIISNDAAQITEIVDGSIG